MAAGNLSALVRIKILRHIDKSENYLRSQMEKERTAMEITPLLLKKNFTTIQNMKEARELFIEIQNIVTGLGKTTKVYTGEDQTWKVGVRYVSQPDKLILIAPTYTSLRKFLSYKISRNSVLETNKHVGIETYVDKDDENKIKTRSKFDIGHTVGFGKEERNAVSAARAFKALDFVKEADPTSIAILQKLFLDKFEKAHAKYNLKSTKQVSMGKDLVAGGLTFVYTVPQAYSVNQKLGGVEKGILQELRKHLFTGKGSKPIVVSVTEQLGQMFLDKKVSSTNTTTNVSGKGKLPKPKLNIKTRKGTKPKAAPLQTARGRFTSIASLQSLLQPLVTELVGVNMDSANYFKTDSGNFTEGVKIRSISRAGTNGIDVNYEYETSRYGSFESGGRHHSAGREPSNVIGNSIRAAAKTLIHNKFRVNPVGSSF